MKFVEIGPETEAAFFHCLHPPETPEPAYVQERRQWYARHKPEGYRAQVLVLDSGEIVGKCHTIPIEHSPLTGSDLLVILCLYVHMYEEHLGDRRKQGYGRFILEAVEENARSAGFNGVATWAMDWAWWNPVSFYEHMGYTRADQEDRVVAVWKPFSPEAQPPRLLRLPAQPRRGQEKVSVFVADNGWCNGFEKLETVQQAIAGLQEIVDFQKAGAPCWGRIIHLGHVGGVFLDGQAYRPYQVIGSSEDLRAEILRVSEERA